uniref:Arginase n=2 Tax=Caenorhabditis japonica TaxID=281687 RepID=A0A8R1HRY5_CAEJA
MIMKKSTQLARQIIRAVGCANGLAGRQLGCENAVEVIKASPYFANVQQKVPLKWGKTIEEVNTGRHANALTGVTQTCRQLAHETRQVIENKEELLVFGGDHSCAIGTWSGVATALRPAGDIGLIWVDAHMDAHTPDSSDTGNIHGMPVAHLLGYGDKNLARIGDRLPKLLPHNLCMVGIRDYESAEQELLERLGVRIFYAHEVDRRGIQDVLQEAQYLVTRNTIGYGLSIDLDGFDVSYAPAVGTPSDDGINALEFIKALLTIDLTKLIATEIVEFLPKFDDNQRTSEQLVSSLVEYIYKTKEFQMQSVNEIVQRVGKCDESVRVSQSL